ncbi:hypothetical protein ACHAW5_009334 [Stephanodiscus triporus]|uniref:Uncharacterized protein n=1 Tax=Stephanodiscus triporus TaxID=2934178 RepID=A0ABD3PGR0_9STRA
MMFVRLEKKFIQKQRFTMTIDQWHQMSVFAVTTMCLLFQNQLVIFFQVQSDLPTRSSPPIMTVIYSYDACLGLTRDGDDAISYTRSLGKPALALRQALSLRRDVRRHEVDELIDDFFIALLRFGSRGKARPLSFSRLKIAAESLPILLGGDSRMWQRWIFMFSRIPGGLFVIREKIPVRDPELPACVFEMCLETMLEDVILNNKGQGNIISDDEPQRGEDKIVGKKMADLFLETMRCWGTTSTLRKRVQLHRYCGQNHRWGLQWHSSSGASLVDPFIQQAEKDLHRRISQTAFGVLENAHFSTSPLQNNSSIRQYIDSSQDSLFDVDRLLTRLATRLQLSGTDNGGSYVSSNVFIGNMGDKPAIIFEAMAELELMRERFDRALGYFLAIGSRFMNESLTLLEETAVQAVNSFVNDSIDSSSRENSQLRLLSHEGDSGVERNKYGFVLSLIELHQLSHILLKRNYFFSNDEDHSLAESPVVALIALIGLSQAGAFLVDNCSPPVGTSVDSDDEAALSGSNLPVDLVAEQFKTRPKLLYWFLFQVLIYKADMYVNFPMTAVPPAAIIDLHRVQFSLFVDFSEESRPEERDGNQSLPTSMNDRGTPFMAFLRAALPHGGVQADNVRKSLETCRGGNADSPVFARELAFVIENFSNGSIDDAKEILQLYLRGAKNLFMAVEFAERNTMYSSVLFDMLVNHCTSPDPTSDANQNSLMGALFGSLLEAAAHAGSDLASLVSRIPEGMSIEGLRPKLIAAITDYRYKVKIHEHVDKILVEDKVSILRELTYVSRRGERISLDESNNGAKSTRTVLLAKSSDLLKSQRRKVSPTKILALPVR